MTREVLMIRKASPPPSHEGERCRRGAPAAKLDLALPDMIREGLGCWSGPEPVMGEKIIPLPDEDAERIRGMTVRMANGDETAFKEFYECYCDRLFRYLLLLTRGNEDLARDLLQITMTKVVPKAAHGHP